MSKFLNATANDAKAIAIPQVFSENSGANENGFNLAFYSKAHAKINSVHTLSIFQICIENKNFKHLYILPYRLDSLPHVRFYLSNSPLSSPLLHTP